MKITITLEDEEIEKLDAEIGLNTLVNKKEAIEDAIHTLIEISVP